MHVDVKVTFKVNRNLVFLLKSLFLLDNKLNHLQENVGVFEL